MSQRRKVTNTVCEECSKGPVEAPKETTAYRTCKEQYDIVAQCMDNSNGQVRECKQEWADFNACWKQERAGYFNKLQKLDAQAELDVVRER